VKAKDPRIDDGDYAKRPYSINDMQGKESQSTHGKTSLVVLFKRVGMRSVREKSIVSAYLVSAAAASPTRARHLVWLKTMSRTRLMPFLLNSVARSLNWSMVPKRHHLTIIGDRISAVVERLRAVE